MVHVALNSTVQRFFGFDENKNASTTEEEVGGGRRNKNKIGTICKERQNNPTLPHRGRGRDRRREKRGKRYLLTQSYVVVVNTRFNI